MKREHIILNDDPHYQHGGLGWACSVAFAVATLSTVQAEQGKAPSIEVLPAGARDDIRLALIVIAHACTQAMLDNEVA